MDCGPNQGKGVAILPCIQPRKTMEQSQSEIQINDVNGSPAGAEAVASGQNDYVQQVASDHHQATVCGQNSHGEQVAAGQNATARSDRKFKIGTWNVNTLHQPGKLDNLKRETENIGVDLSGVSEVRYMAAGMLKDGKWKFFYSGGDNHQYGVGILVRGRMADAVSGWWPVSDRIIYVKISGSPININILQVYAPTGDHTDEEIEEFYQELDDVTAQCKEYEINIVMGDLNAKIGEGREGGLVEDFGLGVRNERGDRWLEWCVPWRQVILDSWYRQHPRYLWTWRSPRDRFRNQIDYITINNRFRNAVTRVKTYPGADCGAHCDHVPLIANVKLKFKKIRKPKRKIRKDWDALRTNMQMKEHFQIELQNKYQVLENAIQEDDDTQDEYGLEEDWQNLQRALVSTAEDIVPEREGKVDKNG